MYYIHVLASTKYFFKRRDGNLTVGFDGAWQKRGTGHAYNSLTGNFLIYFSLYEIYLLGAF